MSSGSADCGSTSVPLKYGRKSVSPPRCIRKNPAMYASPTSRCCLAVSATEGQVVSFHVPAGNSPGVQIVLKWLWLDFMNSCMYFGVLSVATSYNASS